MVGRSGGAEGVEVALMGALVDAVLDAGGAAVACPYLCALFQSAAAHKLKNGEGRSDTAVSCLALPSEETFTPNSWCSVGES